MSIANKKRYYLPITFYHLYLTILDVELDINKEFSFVIICDKKLSIFVYVIKLIESVSDDKFVSWADLSDYKRKFLHAEDAEIHIFSPGYDRFNVLLRNFTGCIILREDGIAPYYFKNIDCGWREIIRGIRGEHLLKNTIKRLFNLSADIDFALINKILLFRKFKHQLKSKGQIEYIPIDKIKEQSAQSRFSSLFEEMLFVPLNDTNLIFFNDKNSDFSQALIKGIISKKYFINIYAHERPTLFQSRKLLKSISGRNAISSNIPFEAHIFRDKEVFATKTAIFTNFSTLSLGCLSERKSYFGKSYICLPEPGDSQLMSLYDESICKALNIHIRIISNNVEFSDFITELLNE